MVLREGYISASHDYLKKIFSVQKTVRLARSGIVQGHVRFESVSLEKGKTLVRSLSMEVRPRDGGPHGQQRRWKVGLHANAGPGAQADQGKDHC